MGQHPIELLKLYSGKKVLITGASGYLAGHMAHALKESDCEVFLLSRKTLPNSLSWADEKALSDTLKTVDIIFHFGAQTSAYKSEENPEEDFSANVGALSRILSSLHVLKNRATVIIASTVTVYGLTEANEPISEDKLTAPTTIYDVDKLTAENYLEHFCKRGSVKGASLRLANVYGPGVASSSNDRGILNQIVKKGMNQEPITVFGDGNYLRDYVYVTDVVSAFLHTAVATSAPLMGERYNVATGHSRTLINAINEVGNVLRENNHAPLQITHVKEPDYLLPIEKRNFTASVEKIKMHTGWSPKTEFKKGLIETLRSFQ